MPTGKIFPRGSQYSDVGPGSAVHPFTMLAGESLLRTAPLLFWQFFFSADSNALSLACTVETAKRLQQRASSLKLASSRQGETMFSNNSCRNSDQSIQKDRAGPELPVHSESFFLKWVCPLLAGCPPHGHQASGAAPATHGVLHICIHRCHCSCLRPALTPVPWQSSYN